MNIDRVYSFCCTVSVSTLLLNIEIFELSIAEDITFASMHSEQPFLSLTDIWDACSHDSTEH